MSPRQFAIYSLMLLCQWFVPPRAVQADWLALLDDDCQGLQARCELIDQAQHDIGLIYWTIDSSEVPRALIGKLCQQACRGVRVRILADGLATRIAPDLLAAMESSGVEFRIYHPLWLMRPGWLNQRLHSKLLVVDRSSMVLGGRNLTDRYFHSGGRGFADSDVAVIGAVCEQAACYFELIWNSSEVADLAECSRNLASSGGTSGLAGALSLGMLPFSSGSVPCRSATHTPCDRSAMVHCDAEGPSEAGCEQAIRVGCSSPARAPMEAAEPCQSLVWLPVATEELCLLHDGQPIKACSPMTDYLIALIDAAECSIVIESPYPVFTDRFRAALSRATSRGVTVWLMTNSLSSTDKPLVYAAYHNQKSRLLGSGVQLFEYNGPQHLHAKHMVVDGQVAVVGSYNFDHRADCSDLELCLISSQPAVADLLLDSILRRHAGSQRVVQSLTVAPLPGVNTLRRAHTRAAQLVIPLVKPLL